MKKEDELISCPSCSVFYKNKSFQNEDNKTIVYKAVFIKTAYGIYEIKAITKRENWLLKTSIID